MSLGLLANHKGIDASALGGTLVQNSRTNRIGTHGQATNLAAAVEAAHEREMTVVALTGTRGGRLAPVLRDTDVHICVPADQPSRIQEVHQLVLHCIADGLDAQLLGPPETPNTEQENPA